MNKKINKSQPAPVIVFAYNRLSHLKKTIESLKSNFLAAETDLYIFSDGGKSYDDWHLVKAVRNYLYKIKGFNKISIIERDVNFGLAKSVIEGVSDVLARHSKVIVLEDDLLTSRYFLKFMNEALNIYEDNVRVGMINGHIYNINGLSDCFFLYKSGCLGWATWRDRWNNVCFDGELLLKKLDEKNLKNVFDINGSFNFYKMLQDQVDGKNSSWAVRLYASFLLNDILTFYPGKSLVQHIGYDIGTHVSGRFLPDDLDGVITDEDPKVIKIPVVNSEVSLLKLEGFFRVRNSFFNRFKRKVSVKFNAIVKKECS